MARSILLKYRIFLLWLISISVVFSAAAYFLFFLVLLPAQQKQSTARAAERLKIIAENRSLQFSQAIRTDDDITVIKTIKEIMSEPDILYVRVISTGGIIIAHSNIEQNSGIVSDSAGIDARDSSKTILARINDPPGFDFSVPLFIHEKRFAALSIGMSKKGVEDENALQRKYYYTAYVLFLVSLILSCSLLFYFILIRRLKKLKTDLENVLIGDSTERMTVHYDDEIDSISKIINRILDKRN